MSVRMFVGSLGCPSTIDFKWNLMRKEIDVTKIKGSLVLIVTMRKNEQTSSVNDDITMRDIAGSELNSNTVERETLPSASVTSEFEGSSAVNAFN